MAAETENHGRLNYRIRFTQRFLLQNGNKHTYSYTCACTVYFNGTFFFMFYTKKLTFQYSGNDLISLWKISEILCTVHYLILKDYEHSKYQTILLRVCDNIRQILLENIIQECLFEAIYQSRFSCSFLRRSFNSPDLQLTDKQRLIPAQG